ncbi:hypothetical protein C8E87_3177 [Paractinoplanes brasiliensis]|uniref:Uncharacterized protein n=1 Tax=Paractinoplanes brasiliensis TaxID=52695 RepID=A0A4R6JWE5_9ACTN|nr:hypothetical protein C8E87_3177 [Actinoplanes brasiliensis]
MTFRRRAAVATKTAVWSHVHGKAEVVDAAMLIGSWSAFDHRAGRHPVGRRRGSPKHVPTRYRTTGPDHSPRRLGHKRTGCSPTPHASAGQFPAQKAVDPGGPTSPRRSVLDHPGPALTTRAPVHPAADQRPGPPTADPSGPGDPALDNADSHKPDRGRSGLAAQAPDRFATTCSRAGPNWHRRRSHMLAGPGRAGHTSGGGTWESAHVVGFRLVRAGVDWREAVHAYGEVRSGLVCRSGRCRGAAPLGQRRKSRLGCAAWGWTR